jgi:hypothetical protein
MPLLVKKSFSFSTRKGVTFMEAVGTFESFLSSVEAPSVVNGATIVNVQGSIATGASSATIEQGASLNGYRHLAITAKNKPGSLSALTFTFQEINAGIGGSTTVTLATLRVTPGTTGYSYVATALAGLSDSLTITASADPAQPSGEDNFTVTVTAYTS